MEAYLHGFPAYYQVVPGKYENQIELSIVAGTGAPLIWVIAENTHGRDFYVHDQDEDGVVEISVRRMDKELVQRAVRFAIGKVASVTWATADRKVA
jgi:hypothetical protein